MSDVGEDVCWVIEDIVRAQCVELVRCSSIFCVRVCVPLYVCVVCAPWLTCLSVCEQLVQSRKLAGRRQGKALSPEDVIFLIRHDRAKVNRLRTYLSWKDVRKNARENGADPAAGGAGGGEMDALPDEGAQADPTTRPAGRGKMRMPWEVTTLYTDNLRALATMSTAMASSSVAAAAQAAQTSAIAAEDDEDDEEDIEAQLASQQRLKVRPDDPRPLHAPVRGGRAASARV